MPLGMEKQWQLNDPNPQTVRTLTERLACSPLMARLLAIRGIDSKIQADRFLNPSFANLTPPSALADMDIAVQRIHRALQANEKILLVGDYDADGVTATAALTAFLRQCGARLAYAIPHRIADGYGMGVDFVQKRVLPAGFSLIVTVDCGSGNAEAVNLARRTGVETIVTDHHPIGRLPEDALAVINPSRSDCQARLAHLSGVGVAFYLVIALRSHLRKVGFWKHRREPNLRRLCDLVALGTVADVVPLVAENRVLTAAGLQQINQGPRPGIAALMRLSTTLDLPVDAEAIAFRLAPRINAAGRLAHARMACELLLAESPQKAAHLARALCRLNRRRQTMENELLQLILDRITQRPGWRERAALVVHGNGWHEGILGIVASRLVRQFHRPAVVIGTRNGQGKGSARSIDGIDLSMALGQCADLLDRFGGHPLAAGLSLRAANVKAFAHRLEKVVGRMAVDRPVKPALAIDARLPLDQITVDLMDALERLGPFGQGNPAPVFMDTQVRIHACKTVGDRHRRMVLESGAGAGRHTAIQFNVTTDSLAVHRFEKIAYRPQWNCWNGRKSLQLVIEDTDPQC